MNNSNLVFGLMAAYKCNEYSFEELRGLTAPFGMTETSLRTNLSRLTRKEVLTSRKKGKSAYYSLSKKGGYISSNVAFSFRKLDWSQWDGSWWGVLFTLPNEANEQRHIIRKKLTAYRFTCFYSGFWIRPMHPDEKIEYHLDSLINAGSCTLIKFTFTKEIPKKDVAKIWKLNKINETFVKVLDKLRTNLGKASDYMPEEALKYKIILGNEIVNALFTDPMLPDAFLPSNWRGDELRLLFRDFDETMTEIAASYIKEVLMRDEIIKR